MAKISIIVPVYNIDKYIDECIQSIVNQTLKDIEIITVDDGSTDNSLNILKNWSKKDKRIKVIHKENGGVTSARYTGILSASGKYVGFVDGDDYISNNMYENLYKAAVENEVDAVYCESYYVRNFDKTDIVSKNTEVGLYCGNKLNLLTENMFDYKNNLNGGLLESICCNIYNKSKFISVIRELPTEIKTSEDITCLYCFTTICEKIFILNTPYYYYRRRQNSACYKIYENFFTDIDKNWHFLKKYAKNRDTLLKEFKMYIIHKTLSFRIFSDRDLSFYLFPYEKIKKGSNIVLYGAGSVGISYLKQIKETKYCNITLWTDTKFQNLSNEKYLIEDPDKIKEIDYDYILVSVLSKGFSDGIKNSLITKYNIDENKIITHSPLSLLNLINI